MPRGDRSGPDGEGPKTGRGLGYCNGYEHPGFLATGRGRRGGWRRGFSFRRRIPVDDAVDEVDILQDEISRLKNRIDELEKDDGKQ